MRLHRDRVYNEDMQLSIRRNGHIVHFQDKNDFESFKEECESKLHSAVTLAELYSRMYPNNRESMGN